MTLYNTISSILFADRKLKSNDVPTFNASKHFRARFRSRIDRNATPTDMHRYAEKFIRPFHNSIPVWPNALEVRDGDITIVLKKNTKTNYDLVTIWVGDRIR